jgi:hypothetical protein
MPDSFGMLSSLPRCKRHHRIARMSSIDMWITFGYVNMWTSVRLNNAIFAYITGWLSQYVGKFSIRFRVLDSVLDGRTKVV